jgi:hypothetical protein
MQRRRKSCVAADLLAVREQIAARGHCGADTRTEPLLCEQLGGPGRIPVSNALDRELDHVESEALTRGASDAKRSSERGDVQIHVFAPTEATCRRYCETDGAGRLDEPVDRRRAAADLASIACGVPCTSGYGQAQGRRRRGDDRP